MTGAAVPATDTRDDLPELGGEPQQTAGSDELTPEQMEKISKMTANPVGAAWMLWTQNDTSSYEGDLVPGSETGNSFKFQPVMSFPVDFGDEPWNLIVRPVFQYQSVPLDKDVGVLPEQPMRQCLLERDAENSLSVLSIDLRESA